MGRATSSSFLLSLVLCLAAAWSLALVDAKAVDFTLYMVGKCDFPHDCVGKANSQKIETTISPSDAINQRVTDVIGSHAIAIFSAVPVSNNTYTETGNITFGTHLSRDHALFYRTFDLGYVSHTSLPGQVNVIATHNITGGTGVFSKAYGTMTANGRTRQVGHTVEFEVFLNGIVHDATA